MRGLAFLGEGRIGLVERAIPAAGPGEALRDGVIKPLITY
ncbi:hypothetical protein GCM10010472_35530 [Pseudonocardia halophobica]|uniref:Uncharacterized protein n=1 Tax=Pseudonocardia halophobica TaxID=29401 RepID=A0A9W6NX63_9PSEU|nr:hypothetical protein GCM10017577_33330 [Pseudonocardia halophobica]